MATVLCAKLLLQNLFSAQKLQYRPLSRNKIEPKDVYSLIENAALYNMSVYFIDTYYEIAGFFLLPKNHIFITRSEDTIFIFHA